MIEIILLKINMADLYVIIFSVKNFLNHFISVLKENSLLNVALFNNWEHMNHNSHDTHELIGKWFIE